MAAIIWLTRILTLLNSSSISHPALTNTLYAPLDLGERFGFINIASLFFEQIGSILID